MSLGGKLVKPKSLANFCQKWGILVHGVEFGKFRHFKNKLQELTINHTKITLVYWSLGVHPNINFQQARLHKILATPLQIWWATENWMTEISTSNATVSECHPLEPYCKSLATVGGSGPAYFLRCKK